MKYWKGTLLIFIVLISLNAMGQTPENWTSRQLIEPSELASILQSGKHIPLIVCVGPGAIIPQSINAGMARDEEHLKQLKKQLEGVPKNKHIVIYCGCCPFDHCPNVRPAIQVLKDMKFTNYQLLDLPHNIKTDWLNKGYPSQN